jgi:hypothetical protein
MSHVIHRKSILSPEQKRNIQDWQNLLGLSPMQARYRELTPDQRREFNRQVRIAEQRRYLEDPYAEIIKAARNSARSAMQRDVSHGAHEFTITVNDLEWPTHCPVFPWIDLHYPGWYRGDPAGASLDRLNVKKDYVPGNVHVVSLRANLLRKDATAEELRALAEFYHPFNPDN